MLQLELFKGNIPTSPVNVAMVPMRSPFRYPGGKTWFVPYARKWLRQFNGKVDLVEPFGGGGIVGLTAAFEGLSQKVIIIEKDEDVASVWQTILGCNAKWLVDRIINFEITSDSVRTVFAKEPESLREQAFRTILKNRSQHGGILAQGAGLIKNGENGKGLKSRWYPETISKRIQDIWKIRDKIEFIQGDGLEFIQQNKNRKKMVFFIDPPYTKAGRRLYSYHDIDHEGLFDLVTKTAGDILITYDDALEIETMAVKHGLQIEKVPMKTTHHLKKYELVIGKNLTWLRDW